jgi:hypothetical protein
LLFRGRNASQIRSRHFDKFNLDRPVREHRHAAVNVELTLNFDRLAARP